MAESIGPGVGERAPDFVAPDVDGREVRFYGRAGGRPALLLFVRQPGGEPPTAGLGAVASIHHIVPESLPIAALADVRDTALRDDGVVRNAFHLPADADCAVLLDRNLRALGAVRLEDPDALATLEAALPGEATSDATVTAQAPVLFVPRVLAAQVCDLLMQRWAASNVETGIERNVDDDGHRAGRQDVIDEQAKRRRDHVVDDATLTKMLTQTIGRRVLPEVRRFFYFPADRFEGFKIACYESTDAGFFHAHRDNLSSSTAHRRFAMTLNLNDDFEGGELRFPEFGEARYRPGAGEALLFSCAMLHEVLPVTAGTRFTLLSFLFDAAASRGGGPSQGAQQ